MLALRYGKQLGNALVETSDLLDELRELATLLRILSSQRFQLVHRRVQIILGDLCRSSFLLFRSDAVVDTILAARQ